jgi:hypothetical protein
MQAYEVFVTGMEKKLSSLFCLSIFDKGKGFYVISNRCSRRCHQETGVFILFIIYERSTQTSV